MIGEDFIYNNTWLSHFKMKMYDPDEVQSFVSREIEKSNQSSVRNTPNHYSTHYSDVLQLNFFILKNDCLYQTQNEMTLSNDELNSLRSWLESPKQPCELYVQSKTNNTDTYYYGLFTDVQPFIVGGDCYGLKLTFTCNAPYGFSPVIHRVVSINGQNGTFNTSFPNLSAELNEFLRPKITITAKSSSTFNGNEKIVITNTSDNDNSMIINLPTGYSCVIIDCDKKMITDKNGALIPLSKLGFTLSNNGNLIQDYFNPISAESGRIYWLKLPSGNNDIAIVTENCGNVSDVRICGRYPVKAGEF